MVYLERPRRVRFIAGLVLVLCVTTISACETQTTEEKLETAEMLLRTDAGNAFSRARALGLFRAVRSESSDTDVRIRADFGVGMVGFIDLIHTVARVANPVTTENDNGDGDDSATALPPAEDLVPVISTLVDVVLDEQIIQPWTDVIAQETFSFQFDPGGFVLPPFSEDGEPVDLSGIWDLTEIRLIYGILQSAVAAFKYIELYDDVLEVVVDAALTDVTIPDLPSSPAEFPLWIVDTAQTLGLDPLPWLRPEFGVLASDSPTQLVALRARASDGLNAIVAGFEHLNNEDDSDQEEQVFPKSEFIKQLLVRTLNVDPGDLAVQAIDPLIGSDRLLELTSVLRDSLDTDAVVFLPPDWVWELIDTALTVAVGDYSGPKNPTGMRIPAINVSALFTAPVEDLKDRETGVLPYYCDDSDLVSLAADCDQAGVFVTRSEQEPNDGVLLAGDFEDIGIDTDVMFADADTDGADDGTDLSIYANNSEWEEPIALRAGDAYLEDSDDAAVLPPLAHIHPDTTQGIELANGIVDPVYLFFGNANFNGMLRPITETSTEGAFAVLEDQEYTNPDLMRLLSVIIWIVDSVD